MQLGDRVTVSLKDSTFHDEHGVIVSDNWPKRVDTGARGFSVRLHNYRSPVFFWENELASRKK